MCKQPKLSLVEYVTLWVIVLFVLLPLGFALGVWTHRLRQIRLEDIGLGKRARNRSDLASAVRYKCRRCRIAFTLDDGRRGKFAALTARSRYAERWPGSSPFCFLDRRLRPPRSRRQPLPMRPISTAQSDLSATASHGRTRLRLTSRTFRRTVKTRTPIKARLFRVLTRRAPGLPIAASGEEPIRSSC